MNNLTPQQQIDLAAERMRLMLAPFALNQHELDSMIDWAKRNAKAYEAWREGKPAEMLVELLPHKWSLIPHEPAVTLPTDGKPFVTKVYR